MGAFHTHLLTFPLKEHTGNKSYKNHLSGFPNSHSSPSQEQRGSIPRAQPALPDGIDSQLRGVHPDFKELQIILTPPTSSAPGFIHPNTPGKTPGAKGRAVWSPDPCRGHNILMDGTGNAGSCSVPLHSREWMWISISVLCQQQNENISCFFLSLQSGDGQISIVLISPQQVPKPGMAKEGRKDLRVRAKQIKSIVWLQAGKFGMKKEYFGQWHTSSSQFRAVFRQSLASAHCHC